MRTQHTHGLATLHHQRFILVQIYKALQYLIKRLPVTGRLTNATIYHQVFRALCHFRVQVILYHSVSSLGYPILAGKLCAARSADDAGCGI